MAKKTSKMPPKVGKGKGTHMMNGMPMTDPEMKAMMGGGKGKKKKGK